jgi:hypothetical protein
MAACLLCGVMLTHYQPYTALSHRQGPPIPHHNLPCASRRLGHALPSPLSHPPTMCLLLMLLLLLLPPYLPAVRAAAGPLPGRLHQLHLRLHLQEAGVWPLRLRPLRGLLPLGQAQAEPRPAPSS